MQRAVDQGLGLGAGQGEGQQEPLLLEAGEHKEQGGGEGQQPVVVMHLDDDDEEGDWGDGVVAGAAAEGMSSAAADPAGGEWDSVAADVSGREGEQSGPLIQCLDEDLPSGASGAAAAPTQGHVLLHEDEEDEDERGGVGG